MKLDDTFSHIVSNPKLVRFSTGDIRTAYLTINTQCELSVDDLRRFIYAELNKLVKRGWMVKKKSEKKGITSYVKTELFNIEPNLTSLTFAQTEVNTVEISPVNNFQEINCRLQDYKNDLLEGLGEAEEYRELRQEFPFMHDELQPNYSKTREENSRLLGKIRALETILKNREEG